MAQNRKAQPAACCQWLHGAVGEACWAGMHEGVGEVEDAMRVMCCPLPVLCCCLGSEGGCGDGDVAVQQRSEATLAVSVAFARSHASLNG